MISFAGENFPPDSTSKSTFFSKSISRETKWVFSSALYMSCDVSGRDICSHPYCAELTPKFWRPPTPSHPSFLSGFTFSRLTKPEPDPPPWKSWCWEVWACRIWPVSTRSLSASLEVFVLSTNAYDLCRRSWASGYLSCPPSRMFYPLPRHKKEYMASNADTTRKTHST